MKPVIELPAQAPRSANPFARGFSLRLLRLAGWKMVGNFPDLPKLIVIAAPHTSGWDAVWAICARQAMALDIGFLAKKELFFGPLGWLLRRVGGVPTDRNKPGGMVDDAVARFAQTDRLWLALAPEGTRRKVKRWKTGFWRIAHTAHLPIVCAYFHYPERTIGIGPVFLTSDDMVADLLRIRDWYRPWQGKHRRTQ